MKILFIASNPNTQDSLEVEREINDLQQRLLKADKRGAIELKVLSNLAIEDFASVMLDQQPDILHIAAHGIPKNKLLLASKNGTEVRLTAGQLRDLLGAIPVRPSLVFLNACTSANFAKELTTVTSFAIGMTSKIGNPGAVASTAVFYEWLAEGATIAKAYQAANAMLRCIDTSGVEMSLFPSMQDGAKKVFVDPLRLLAAFEDVEQRVGKKRGRADARVKKDRGGHYIFNLGMGGAPPDMTQLVIFTDDETYVESDDDLESDLCCVSRNSPVHGRAWTDFSWQAYGDVKLVGTVSTGRGKAYCAAGTLSNALEQYYFIDEAHGPLGKKLAKVIKDAIADLRSHNGAKPLAD